MSRRVLNQIWRDVWYKLNVWRRVLNSVCCFLQYTSLEAKLCQIESKYLILLQEMKTPVCSEEQSPAREVIAQLLEDALKAETSEQPEQAFFKPYPVR